MILSIIVTSLALLLQLASAVPFYRLVQNLPRDIAYIAHDEGRGVYHAYRSDHSLHGTYVAGNSSDDTPSKRAEPACPPITLGELKTIASWNKIEAYATRAWGPNPQKILVNPSEPELVTFPARTCVSTEPVPVQMGNKQCNENKLNLKGGLVGTNGTLRLIFTQGYSNTASWAVTRAVNIVAGVKIWAAFKIPGIADVGAEAMVNTEIRNEKTSTHETRMDNLMTQEVWVSAIAGKKCRGYVTTKSCNVDAKARVRFVVEGWVWFNYETKRKDHFKWAVNMDSALTRDERSDWLETRGNMKASVTADYGGICD